MVKPISVRVRDESKLEWDAFARQHGVTVAALIDVLGLELHTLDRKLLERVVVEARELAHERARAGGPRPKAQRRKR